jgi:carotenoid 1,2-hydratase
MTQPGIRWQGHAYVDTNAGVEPLENAFKRWYWLRTEPKDGYSEITYHRILLDERIESLRLGYDADGQYRVLEPLGGDNDLPPTPIWRCPRPFCGPSTPRVLKNFEDTPFYARSKLSLNTADDESVIAMYESVDLERFTRPWVQRLLPFRMPRRGRAPNR